MSSVGDRIRAARINAGLATQTALADRVGMRAQSIWRFESAGYMPGRATVKLLASALGVTEAWLEYGEGPVLPHQATLILHEYFDSDFGYDTPSAVRERLWRVDYGALALEPLTLRGAHRVRELIEMNLLRYEAVSASENGAGHGKA